MDKRFMKGRLALVALIAVLCIAIPAAAFAASSNTYPSGSTAQPSVVGVTFTGVGGNSAVVTIDGTAVSSNIAKGTSVTGTWNVQSVLVGAVFKTQWVWTAGTGVDGQIKVYGFPTTLATGAHTVVATLKDGNGVVTDSATWTFTIDSTIPTGGSDLPGTIVAAPECGAVCHPNYNKKPAMGPKCSACHYGADAPDPAVHNFAQGNASGHNTPMYGTVGAHSKWNGEEGVIVTDTAGAVIEQEWALPTASVFWSQSKALNADGSENASGIYSLNPTDSPLVAMDNRGFASAADGAAAINKNVGWGSVVSCTDCHSNMDQTLGPQGANAGKVSLDPNFPDDWTKAEITSFDPTGMRSIATTIGAPNPYYTKLGGNVYMPAEITSGGVAVADQGAAIVGLSIETTTQKVFGTPNGSIEPTLPGYSSTATKTVYPGGFYGLTNIPSTGYSAGVVTGRFICQKCHKLTNSFQGLSIEGNGRGFRDNNLNYMGMSNEAHMEHHNDMVTGQGNCVSCHIAIPHGWKRPRLLVYESDPAPYKTQYYFTNFATNAAAKQVNPAGGIANGNWGFLGWNGTGSAPSFYIATSTVNAQTGQPASTHLEKLSASATAYKELEIGTVPEEFPQYDAQSGTKWGLWDKEAEGVAWPGDQVAPAAKINLSAWDLATNKAVTVTNGDSPIQNNCNACTSASGTTHAPQYGPGGAPYASGAEGINTGVPAWK